MIPIRSYSGGSDLIPFALSKNAGVPANRKKQFGSSFLSIISTICRRLIYPFSRCGRANDCAVSASSKLTRRPAKPARVITYTSPFKNCRASPSVTLPFRPACALKLLPTVVSPATQPIAACADAKSPRFDA